MSARRIDVSVDGLVTVHGPLDTLTCAALRVAARACIDVDNIDGAHFAFVMAGADTSECTCVACLETSAGTE